MYKKSRLIIFTIIVILSFTIPYITNDYTKSVYNYGLIKYTDTFYIFFINSFTVFSFLAISFFGLSIPFILKMLYAIGNASTNSGLNPLIYFPLSLIHGIFEIASLFIIFTVSIEIFRTYYYKLFLNKKKSITKLTKRIIKIEIPVIVFLLAIGAVFEVFITNRLAVFIGENGLF
ncbi:stage II sporulation protein M [Oceanobacillus kimchii]|uniref:stage II sporulation protein M n=1 Tax=Oceanobacillus kimchii TaxID=746691 RepID=UPI000984680C